MENMLILNREFGLPADGFYQIAPLGEFANAVAGVVQVIDRAACEAMAARFTQDAAVANFGGVLVDFDHGSLDTAKSSEASGWVTALQVREGGLFANIRWSDTGEAAVKGGRYRYVSPVWARSDCEDLGDGRVRPLRLLNLAVTNDPNLKGMVPLSNRSQNSEVTIQNEAAAAVDAGKRFKWVLGASVAGPCAACAAVGGQVHTMGEWNGAGMVLPVHPNCTCTMELTGEASIGPVVGLPATPAVANVGWTDEARKASLAIRQAKAATRENVVPGVGRVVLSPSRGGGGMRVLPGAGTSGKARVVSPEVVVASPPLVRPENPGSEFPDLDDDELTQFEAVVMRSISRNGSTPEKKAVLQRVVDELQKRHKWRRPVSGGSGPLYANVAGPLNRSRGSCNEVIAREKAKIREKMSAGV